MKGVLPLLRTLGDCVLINTLARNIKLSYPDLLLTVMVNREYKDIVMGNPDIADVICPQSWDEVLYEIACNGYQKVFFCYQTTQEDNRWHQVDKYRHQHLVSFYASRCGVELRDPKLLIYPQIQEGDSLPQEKTLAVHTTTLVQSKNWVGIGELIHRLREKGVHVVQVGAVEDGQVESDEDLRGKLSLRQLIVYLSKVSWFVGMDSGLSYVAAAAGAKTFVVQGPTIPTTSGPYGENVVSLLSPTRVECQIIRCHGNCRYADQEPHGSCINRLNVSDVIGKVEEVVCAS